MASATADLPTTEPDVVTVDINRSLESIVSMAMTLLAARQRRSN
ncbi:hypothetical protein [Neorhizobium sp. BETTINA12A]|nr:hypothetical protein [Neorhizobium sp. BETTINA12A]